MRRYSKPATRNAEASVLAPCTVIVVAPQQGHRPGSHGVRPAMTSSPAGPGIVAAPFVPTPTFPEVTASAFKYVANPTSIRLQIQVNRQRRWLYEPIFEIEQLVR